MSVDTRELKFIATEEKGEVSAILAGRTGRPAGTGGAGGPDGAHALLVLGHGSGTNMRHRFMEELSDALNDAGVATFRFNYPYSEKGGGGMDGEKVRLATVRAAIETARESADGLPVFAGGHSMSGRMVSMACAQEPIEGLRGIVFFAFPLHASKKNTERAEHLKSVEVPMLFLSGQRDSMADLDLLRPVVDDLERDAARRGYRGSWIQGAEAPEYRRTRHGRTGQGLGRVDGGVVWPVWSWCAIRPVRFRTAHRLSWCSRFQTPVRATPDSSIVVRLCSARI